MASRSHVLVVEDDPLVSEVVMAALEDGYDTSHAVTAVAALDRLRAGGIHLLLLDCTLPGGLDDNLLPEADQRGVPVILMSGDPERMRRIEGKERPHVLKPFSLTALLGVVEGVIGPG
jgi:DNA-binding response OmpR family regulator